MDPVEHDLYTIIEIYDFGGWGFVDPDTRIENDPLNRYVEGLHRRIFTFVSGTVPQV